MMKSTYHYIGPIKRFGKTVVSDWEDETQAVSEAQALNNLRYKAKKYLKLTSDAKVELNPSNLIHLDGLDEEEIREYNRSYDPDYDIPDEREEMYGGNIFMKDSNEVKIATADEHTGSYPNYFGYMHIEHPNLGDFYVSFSVRNGNVRVDGYPWKFLQEPGYKLNKEQKEWVMAHKQELSKISRKVSGTIKLEDNFCTLNPGTVKLKRASKKFNQRDAKFNDEDNKNYSYYLKKLRQSKDRDEADEILDEAWDNLPREEYFKLERWTNANIKDSKFNDVYPKKNETKAEFISRFMKETKEEYPDRDQRLAVAYSYWDKKKRVKDSNLSFKRHVSNILNDITCLNKYTKDELKDLLTDIINEREGVEDGVAYADDLDDLYAIVDRKINKFKDSKIKDWMPSMTPIDYIKEKLDNAGIEYEIEDDVYGESAPFDTWITITKGSDSEADDIICSVVGSAYEWVRDRDGNRRYCKVVTDEDLIDEFN